MAQDLKISAANQCGRMKGALSLIDMLDRITRCSFRTMTRASLPVRVKDDQSHTLYFPHSLITR